MNTLPITSSIAAILALIVFPLSMMVSLKRINIGKSAGNLTEAAIGEYEEDGLKRKIRAFGNFMEYVPISLIMLALVELAAGPAMLLWCLGLALIAGRLLHAGGMLYANNPVYRATGMLLTYPATAIPAIWILYKTLF